MTELLCGEMTSRVLSYLVDAVLAAGVVLAIVRWQASRRVALAVALACGLPLLVRIAALPGVSPLTRLLADATPDARRTAYSLHSLAWLMSLVTSYILLLLAVFRARNR